MVFSLTFFFLYTSSQLNFSLSQIVMPHSTLPVPFLYNFPTKQTFNNFLFPSVEIQKTKNLPQKINIIFLLYFIIPTYEYSSDQLLLFTPCLLICNTFIKILDKASAISISYWVFPFLFAYPNLFYPSIPSWKLSEVSTSHHTEAFLSSKSNFLYISFKGLIIFYLVAYYYFIVIQISFYWIKALLFKTFGK